MNNNVIQRLIFNVDSADKKKSDWLISTYKDLVINIISSQIEKLNDEYYSNIQIEIDQIDIDIDLTNSDIETQVYNQLKNYFDQYNSINKTQSLNEDNTAKTIDAFTHYLKNGYLPWWVSNKTEYDFSDAASQWLENSSLFYDQTNNLLINNNSRVRLSKILSTQQSLKLLSKLGYSDEKKLLDLFEKTISIATSYNLKANKNFYWQKFLLLLTNPVFKANQTNNQDKLKLFLINEIASNNKTNFLNVIRYYPHTFFSDINNVFQSFFLTDGRTTSKNHFPTSASASPGKYHDTLSLFFSLSAQHEWNIIDQHSDAVFYRYRITDILYSVEFEDYFSQIKKLFLKSGLIRWNTDIERSMLEALFNQIKHAPTTTIDYTNLTTLFINKLSEKANIATLVLTQVYFDNKVNFDFLKEINIKSFQTQSEKEPKEAKDPVSPGNNAHETENLNFSSLLEDLLGTEKKNIETDKISPIIIALSYYFPITIPENIATVDLNDQLYKQFSDKYFSAQGSSLLKLLQTIDKHPETKDLLMDLPEKLKISFLNNLLTQNTFLKTKYIESLTDEIFLFTINNVLPEIYATGDTSPSSVISVIENLKDNFPLKQQSNEPKSVRQEESKNFTIINSFFFYITHGYLPDNISHIDARQWINDLKKQIKSQDFNRNQVYHTLMLPIARIRFLTGFDSEIISLALSKVISSKNQSELKKGLQFISFLKSNETHISESVINLLVLDPILRTDLQEKTISWSNIEINFRKHIEKNKELLNLINMEWGSPPISEQNTSLMEFSSQHFEKAEMLNIVNNWLTINLPGNNNEIKKPLHSIFSIVSYTPRFVHELILWLYEKTVLSGLVKQHLFFKTLKELANKEENTELFGTIKIIEKEKAVSTADPKQELISILYSTHHLLEEKLLPKNDLAIQIILKVLLHTLQTTPQNYLSALEYLETEKQAIDLLLTKHIEELQPFQKHFRSDETLSAFINWVDFAEEMKRIMLIPQLNKTSPKIISAIKQLPISYFSLSAPASTMAYIYLLTIRQQADKKQTDSELLKEKLEKYIDEKNLDILKGINNQQWIIVKGQQPEKTDADQLSKQENKNGTNSIFHLLKDTIFSAFHDTLGEVKEFFTSVSQNSGLWSHKSQLTTLISLMSDDETHEIFRFINSLLNKWDYISLEENVSKLKEWQNKQLKGIEESHEFLNKLSFPQKQRLKILLAIFNFSRYTSYKPNANKKVSEYLISVASLDKPSPENIAELKKIISNADDTLIINRNNETKHESDAIDAPETKTKVAVPDNNLYIKAIKLFISELHSIIKQKPTFNTYIQSEELRYEIANIYKYDSVKRALLEIADKIGKHINIELNLASLKSLTQTKPGQHPFIESLITYITQSTTEKEIESNLLYLASKLKPSVDIFSDNKAFNVKKLKTRTTEAINKPENTTTSYLHPELMKELTHLRKENTSANDIFFIELLFTTIFNGRTGSLKDTIENALDHISPHLRKEVTTPGKYPQTSEIIKTTINDTAIMAQTQRQQIYTSTLLIDFINDKKNTHFQDLKKSILQHTEFAPAVQIALFINNYSKVAQIPRKESIVEMKKFVVKYNDQELTEIINWMIEDAGKPKITDIVKETRHKSYSGIKEIENFEDENSILNELIKQKHNWAEEIKEGEKIYITNAGLIIFWPFIEKLFSKLGLYAEKKFIDYRSQEKAVYILQYLVTGKNEFHEHLLALNKIMCGLKISEPLLSNPELSDTEQSECNTLINAVIDHWKIVNNSSPEAIRETFINREGILYLKKRDWNLKVEMKAVDRLLTRIPWGFSTIKLPWNKYIIFTEWI
ncbi:MAG: hypothetical protein K9G70_00215 [Prolixibacteraceae bacterium]|nr:hypothetical protein [Prolixibacteraceae bacterium]